MGRLRLTNNSLVDANQVLPGLYIGGHTALKNIVLLNPKPQVVVSAAQDIDPTELLPSPRSVEYKHLPLLDQATDWNASGQTWRSVLAFGRYVASQWAAGKPVLVVCYAGINRSSLVVGVALRFLGFTGQEAVNLIRQKRGITLTNKTFRDAVLGMTPPLTFVWDKTLAT